MFKASRPPAGGRVVDAVWSRVEQYAVVAMRLYHVPNSSSQRVVWLLEELGEPYELVILGDRASRLADREHMARHPMGRVPVLEDDGGPVFESGAICLYLADKYPQAGLLPPAGTHERGLAYQWSLFAYTELQARALQIRLAGSAEVAEAPTKALREAVDAVDRALQGRDFLVGDRFSVADLLVGTALSAARRLGAVELPAEAGRYLDALESRPAKQRADARNPSPASPT
jgi:glutathione S-transferase